MAMRISDWRRTFWRGDAGLAAVLVAALLLASCAVMRGRESQEIERVPGAFTFSEGNSAYAERYQRALAHLESNELAEAEAIYRELTELEPESANGYIGLGTVLNLQGRPEEAQEAYGMALEIVPDSVGALIGMGSAAMQLASHEEALDWYSAALALDGEDANGHWGAAIALEALGRRAEAVEHLEKVVDLAHGSALGEQAQEMLDEIKGGGG